MLKKITLSLLVATGLFAEATKPIPLGVRDGLGGTSFLSLDLTTTAISSSYIGMAPNKEIRENCFLRNGKLIAFSTDALGERALDVYYPTNSNPTKEFWDLEEKYQISNSLLCSNKVDGQEIFKLSKVGQNWIVKHKQEAMVDKGSFFLVSDHGWVLPAWSEATSDENRKKLSSKYHTFEAFFDDWLTQKIKLIGQEKIVRDGDYAFTGIDITYTNRVPNEMIKYLVASPEMTPALSEMRYFCEGHKGDFMKDGKPFLNTIEAFIRNGAEYSTREKYFNGRYACVGGETPFNVTVNGSQLIAKKGFSSDFFAGSNTQSYQSQSVQPTQAPISNSVVNDDTMIVKNVAMIKGPFSRKQGALNYFGSYNGVDNQGCDLVSVTKSVDRIKNSQDVFNYKYCNGAVIALGETGLPGIPRKSELEPIISSVKASCKQYGAFGSQYNENTIVSCRSLDINHCNLEITIMQDNKLLNKQVINSCQ